VKSPPPDPYDPPVSFWQRKPELAWAAAVFVLTVGLTVLSFPPSLAPEFAYAFAAPAVFWAYLRPSLRLYAWTLAAAQALAWGIILCWLRHVSWVALVLLAPFVGAWIGTWFLAAWWTMPRIAGRPIPVRLAALLGLAGLWVVVEWTRTWLLGGFPWLPLAASQWQRASILQIAAYTGAGGVSFVLIAMNVGFAAYLHRLTREGPAAERRRNRLRFETEDPEPEPEEARDWGLRRRSQEFLLALFLLLVCLSIHVQETFNRAPFTQKLGRVAFVQPDIPQDVKWDPAKGPGIVKVLEETTLSASARRPDLILWPESAMPWPVKGDAGARTFVESLSARAHAPLLLGSVAVEKPAPGAPAGTSDSWYDAAFLVTPDSGLLPGYYAKRHLVPFGEYVPLRPVLGWLDKFVPIGPDFTHGADAAPLVLNMTPGPVAFGPLVCYEDLFPALSRESVLAGSDVLVELTNDAWYGREGAAYQHAAHSVLRAVETRRPVLRCGNAGWSGWIDEFGGIRFNLAGEDGSVYVRGTRTTEVSRDSRWVGRNSFYVDHGDWFVAVAAALALFGYAAVTLDSRGRAAPVTR
jgi:apolipoprotein N-acyltransferase